MRSLLSTALLIGTSQLILSSTAIAQDAGGFYAKAFGGISMLQGSSVSIDSAPSSLSYDGGSTFGGAVGYDYAGSPFKAELEYAYRSGEAADLPAAVGTGGDFASTSVMLNGYYVFDTPSKIVPYVGLGIGYVTEIDFDLQSAGGETEYNDRGGLAYQAMVGAEYPASDRFSIYAEARYFSAGTADLTEAGGGTLSADYDTLDLIAGVTFKF